LFAVQREADLSGFGGYGGDRDHEECLSETRTPLELRRKRVDDFDVGTGMSACATCGRADVRSLQSPRVR
jgi:hypothetical protein